MSHEKRQGRASEGVHVINSVAVTSKSHAENELPDNKHGVSDEAQREVALFARVHLSLQDLSELENKTQQKKWQHSALITANNAVLVLKLTANP